MQKIFTFILIALSYSQCNEVKEKNNFFYDEYDKDSTSSVYEKFSKSKIITDYKDGKKYGFEKTFYENGKIKSLESYWYGVNFGNQILYNQDEQITKVLFFNIDGNKIFDISFDLNGAITSIRGLPLYIVADSYKLRVNDTLKLLIYTPFLPYVDQKLLLKEPINEIYKIMDPSEAKINFYANTFYYEQIFNKGGIYKIELVLELKNRNNGNILNEKTNLEIEVFG